MPVVFSLEKSHLGLCSLHWCSWISGSWLAYLNFSSVAELYWALIEDIHEDHNVGKVWMTHQDNPCIQDFLT